MIGVDVKAEGSVTFSPQDLSDGVADVYNATVDPVHERIVGHDVPDMEAFDVPEVIDREITISANVEAGSGASLETSGDLNVGRTDDRSDGVLGLHRAGKGGVGLVTGAGASIVID